MVVDFKQLARLIAIAVLALGIWLIWWCQSERQVRRAQSRLLGAMESRDYEAFARMLANDYRDQWEQDKAIVLRRSQQVLDQFLLLDIEGEIRSAEAAGDFWVVRQKIVIKGLGGALGIMARDEVNNLKEPFSMAWRKKSWKPWDWELIEVAQRELRIPPER